MCRRIDEENVGAAAAEGTFDARGKSRRRDRCRRNDVRDLDQEIDVTSAPHVVRSRAEQRNAGLVTEAFGGEAADLKALFLGEAHEAAILAVAVRRAQP